MKQRQSQTLEVHAVGPTTEKEKQIAALGPWFHNLHLPSGEQTAPGHPLGDFPRFKWHTLERAIPKDLTGWTVLDIGCNGGFYTFELAKRGAVVTAIDIEERYLKQAAWAARQYNLTKRINFQKVGVYELEKLGQEYDLIWFMGVLYHLRYPLLALDVIRRSCKKMLVLQTLTSTKSESIAPREEIGLNERSRLLENGWPTMSFIEGRLQGDDTNWWVPNEACIVSMLRSAGFTTIESLGQETYRCLPDPDKGVNI